MRPADVVGLVADEARLRVIAAVLLAPGTTDDVAARSSVTSRRVIAALSRLESQGVVAQGPDGVWRFDIEPFRVAARAGVPDPGEPPGSPEEAVLRAFITDGRLTQIPAARGKRLIVLDRLAAEFEPGQKYDERQVNDTLRPWNDDVAALRRYLVDEGFLSRDHGTYWRTGGTVDVNESAP